MDTDSLGRDDFRRYIADELRTNGWAEGTVSIHVSVLRCFLSWIHEEGYTTEDLAQAVEAPKKISRIEEPLSADELQAILDACSGDKWALRDKAIILILLDTGLRRSEIARLRREDVIFKEGHTYLKLLDHKSETLKISILGKETTAVLREYLDSRDDNKPALWLGRWGPLTQHGIYHTVDKRGNIAGVERAHPHLFRKTFATHWTRNGGDRERLMTLGGWTDSDVLDIYILLGSIPDLIDGHRQYGPVDRMLE